MAFDYLGMALDGVVPKTNRMISGARTDHVSCRRHFDVVNVAFVANEPEGPHCRLEVPNHYGSIG